MTRQLNKILCWIINTWFAFTVLVLFLILVPSWHWRVHNYIVVNYSLYFLIFLISFHIYRQAKRNRYIFLNFTLLSLVYSLGFIHLFVGNEYLIGSDYLMYRLFPYRKFLLSLLMGTMIVFVIIDYLFHHERTVVKYIKTFIIILPIHAALYFRFLVNANYVLIQGHYRELQLCVIESHLLAFFFIGLYGFQYYKNERPIGELINPMMGIFFFLVVYDIVDGITELYGVLSPKSQYILTIILILIAVLLFRKLRSVTSEYGRFYDDLLFNEAKLRIKVKKKQSTLRSILNKWGLYFNIVPNRIFFIILMLISSTLFIFFFPEGYGKRILGTFIASAAILIAYLRFVMKKKYELNTYLNK
ncbi:hypothetical protein JW960_28065 [candidate division KSB1 bacterium]|nr:hypothetical protein [candidate division KSB1 bacterium]